MREPMIEAVKLMARQHVRHLRYVLVQEIEERGWWLPGGGVDKTDTCPEAGVREADEEAGCAIELTGVLRIERSVHGSHGRMRTIYHARPVVCMQLTHRRDAVRSLPIIRMAYVLLLLANIARGHHFG